MTRAWEKLILTDFPHHTTENIRFCDTDAVGHVNNVSFGAYLETGRVGLIYDHKIRVNFEENGLQLVLAQLNQGFVNELNWPGNVDIATGISRIGNSSITMLQALFKDGTCACTAEAVLVLMDLKTRKSTPLPEAVIPMLDQLRVDLEI